MFAIIMIAVGLLSIAAILAVFLYSGRIGKNREDILTEKDFNGPQEIIDYSMQNTLSQKTYSIDGDMSLDMGIRSTEAAGTGFLTVMPDYRVSYKVNFKENVDQSETGNEKSSANVALNIEMSSEGGSDDYSANFDVMLFGKDFAYFKLNNFDLGMMGLMLGSQAKQYKGKWYEMNLEEMRKKSEGDFSFDKYSSEEVKKTLSEFKIIKFSEDLGVENVEGADSQHYRAKIDAQAVLGYYKALLNMRDAEARGSDLKEITSQSSKEFDEFTDKYFELIGSVLEKIDIDIWIGKKDFLIRKMSLNGVYDKDFVGEIIKKTVAEEQVKARLQSKDFSVKSYAQRMKRDMDAYYQKNGSYENFKRSSSWGSSYSDSVNFNSNSDSYVIWTALGSTDDIWCIDSAGREGYVLLGFNEWDCSEASSEPKGAPKDISVLVDEEMANIKAEMDFSLSSNLVFGEFNVPVDIQRPENAEDMSKMFDSM